MKKQKEEIFYIKSQKTYDGKKVPSRLWLLAKCDGIYDGICRKPPRIKRTEITTQDPLSALLITMFLSSVKSLRTFHSSQLKICRSKWLKLLPSNNSFSSSLKNIFMLRWPKRGVQVDLGRNTEVVLKSFVISLQECRFIRIFLQHFLKSLRNSGSLSKV